MEVAVNKPVFTSEPKYTRAAGKRLAWERKGEAREQRGETE